jgi:hypothetical protein
MSRSNRPLDGLRGKYLALSIIPTGSKPLRSSTPLMAAAVLIALGAALLFVLAQ